jgi:DNA-binding LacI/PurR family transcriptional regulator
VTSDNFDGGYKAVQYLLEKYQCKSLQIISDYHLSSSRLRIEGAVNATAGNEIPVLQARQRQGRAAALKWAFDQATNLIIEKKLIDGVGIFALNDHLAAGCRSALDKAGVAAPVIGFDGQHWGAYLSPPLETIYQDMDRMACQAALRLLRRMAGSHETGPLLIDVQLKTSADRMIEKAR